MLMGAFFGILRRRQDRLVGRSACSSRSLAGGAARAPPRRSSRSTCAPTRSSAARRSTSSRSGITGYLFIDIYGAGRHARPTSPSIPDVNLAVPRRTCRSSATVFGQLNLMIWIALAARRRRRGSSSSGRRSGLRLRAVRRAPAGGRHGRASPSTRIRYARGRPLRRAGRAAAAPTSRSGSSTRSTRT